MSITQLKQGSLNGLRRQTNECIDNAYRKGYENGKKEPREVTNVEDTNEYQIGYKVGFEDGKKQAIEEIPELANKENEIYNDGYNKGYNKAINDYNGMIQWLHDCTDDFKEFMNKKYGYDVMYLTNPKVDEGVMLYDLICDHDMAEVISEFQKWQEEKKEVEEKIKEGDIVRFNEKSHVYNIQKDREFLVLHVFKDRNLATILYDNGDTSCVELSLVDKTNRHIDEVAQLLDKLRGKE